MSIDDVKSHFSLRTSTYEEYSYWCKDETLFQLCTEPLQDMLPSIRCLDLGGGSGWIARTDHAMSGRHWTVLDLSPPSDSLDQLGVEFVAGDLQNAPFADHLFGHIVMRSVLHYVDAREALRTAHRLITNRGHLVIAQKVYDFENQDTEWHKRLTKLRNPLVQRSWTSQDLAEVIAESGFKVLTQKTYRELRRLPLAKWLSKAGTISSAAQSETRQMIATAPESVQRRLGLNIDNEIISYVRTWSIVVARIIKDERAFSSAVLSLLVERKQDGRLLLQKRKKRYEEPQYYGSWELPQGKLERGETIVECATRELSEETGLKLVTIKSIQSLTQASTDVVQPITVVRTSGELDFIGLALLVEAHGEPRSVDLNREHTWMSVQEVLSIYRSGHFYPLNSPMILEWLKIKGTIFE